MDDLFGSLFGNDDISRDAWEAYIVTELMNDEPTDPLDQPDDLSPNFAWEDD